MSEEADQGSRSDDLKEPLNVKDTFLATALSLKCFHLKMHVATVPVSVALSCARWD